MPRIAHATRFAAGLSLLLATPLAADPVPLSPWGPADRIGAMNHLSADATRKAARLVKLGKVYALGVVTGPSTPVWPGRSYKIVVTPSDDGSGQPLGANRVTGHDDVLMTHVGIGSQLDGFAHIGIAHHHYNNVPAKELFAPDGVRTYGSESVPPAATRGILLDMVKANGGQPLAPGTAFNRPQIEAALKAAGLRLRKGDVVLFHTGWMARMAEKEPLAFIASQPGLGREGAEWLAGQGVAMVGADTAALEAIPFEKADEPFIVHQTLLTRHGIHILENMDTNALAADGATEFLFVLGVPRLQGTVQAIINPVAIR
ncbi:cyclase family protein [Thermaurantiacus sp.]